MTDESLDRTVRDADPYRPAVGTHLDGAAQHLLEEILSVPTLEPVAETPVKRLRARRRLISGLAGAGVAATALAAVLVASTLRADQPDGRQAAPTAGSGVTYSAMVLLAAERNPRLLIDQPGWKATTVYGFAEKTGTIGFRNGTRQLEMNWYEAGQYDGYYRDRLGVSKPEAVRVDGRPGNLFTYDASDFAVMLKPRDGSFVELRTGGHWTRAEFDRVVADVRHVDVQTWLAALPPEIVTPGRVDEQAEKALAGVPLPPGFDRAALATLGTNDPYQFGAAVTSLVGCGWIAEWLRAKQAGDEAGLRKAADALRGSRDWPVLHQINGEGGWPEVFWQVTGQVAAGSPPADYAQSLGCR